MKKLTATQRKQSLERIVDEGGVISTIEMLSDICHENKEKFNPSRLAYRLWNTAEVALDKLSAELFLWKSEHGL